MKELQPKKYSSKEHIYTREALVGTPLSIHQRPAALLVKFASQYADDITFNYKGNSVSGKSIMGVMTLGMQYKHKVKISVTGNGTAEECLDNLVAVIEDDLDNPKNPRVLNLLKALSSH